MFKPTIYVKHVKDINYEKLKEKGIKLLCFDLDNTIDAPDRITKEIDSEIIVVLDKIKLLGFETYIISNNALKGRVDSFVELSGIKGIHNARKPFQKTYENDPIIGSFEKSEVVFIGDKIVTDIIGANRFGSMSILVDPLVEKNKKWYTIIMGLAEIFFSTLICFKRGSYYDKS